MKDNWEALVNAIVLKAVEDYRKARRRVRRFPGQKGAQAYMLDQQIQTKMHQLSSLRSLSESMHSFRASEPVSHTKNVTMLEDAVIKIMEEEQELNAEIDRLVDLKREIRDVIAEVQDLNLRLILEKRHLCFESWPQIGDEMGHTERWAQVKHKMALIVVQAILDRRAA